MLIIIEGCDRTGKTTLATQLADEIPRACVQHAGPPTNHPLVDYEQSIMGYDPRGSKTLILDRFHLGEHVWPTIFKRVSYLDRATARHIELFLASRGATLVYATRSAYSLARDIDAAEPPEPIRGEQVTKVFQLFDHALAFGSRNVCDWDYERHGAEQRQRIRRVGRMTRDDVRPVWELLGGEWIGESQSPHVMLIGDEFGPVRPHRPDLHVPFVTWPATSGKYLMEALPSWWRKAFIANAHTGRTGELQRRLPDAWELLGKPPVIALGTRAAGALAKLKVPHEVVNHPQYWRRFRHYDKSSYTTLIDDALAAA